MSQSAIRYYERIGLLLRAERIAGQRVFGSEVLARLTHIDMARRAGLSLDEIRDVLEDGSAPLSNRLHELAARKLPEVEALVSRAEAMQSWLQAAASCTCEDIDECALFDPEVTDAKLPVQRDRGVSPQHRVSAGNKIAAGAVSRPTSTPALTPPARGGRGGLEPSRRWSLKPLSGGASGA